MKRYSPDEKCSAMTRDQVRAFDAWAINTLGVPGVVLMENAGRSCAELIKEQFKNKKKPKACIFCGTGNNGGDGYVIARHLINSNFSAKVIICGDKGKVKGDAKINLDILEKMGQPVELLNMQDDKISQKIKSLADEADIIVDAIFGTGLTGSLKDNYKELITAINEIDVPVLAVDIPSGLDCDTGNSLGEAVCADWTVTFAAVKKGFTTGENVKKFTGQIYVASIGIEPTME